MVPFCRGCSALCSCGLSDLEVVTGNRRVRSLFGINLNSPTWNYLDLCQLGWPRIKITFSVGSEANDTCFLRDFSPSSSRYCSSSSFFVSPTFPLSKRQNSCGWTAQPFAVLGNVYRPNSVRFAPGACTARTRRNRSCSQFFPELSFKLTLLCYFSYFSGKI